MIERLVIAAMIAVLAALVAAVEIRALARCRSRIEAAAAWGRARIELQMLTMDVPEVDGAAAVALQTLNENGVPR